MDHEGGGQHLPRRGCLDGPADYLGSRPSRHGAVLGERVPARAGAPPGPDGAVRRRLHHRRHRPARVRAGPGRRRRGRRLLRSRVQDGVLARCRRGRLDHRRHDGHRHQLHGPRALPAGQGGHRHASRQCRDGRGARAPVTGPSPYALGDLEAQPGAQVRGHCVVSLGTNTTVTLPVAITHGTEPGPVLAVTAGIHGGEYVPMVAVRQFIRGLDPARMRGTVVACPQSSPASFEQRAAFVNPLDGRNLNRSFPGDPLGGPTSRLAAWLWENLLARADYYVDCHCGDLPEVLDSFAGVSAGPDGVVSEQVMALADCFDVARLIVDRTEGSTILQAALAGIPAVLVEVGGQGRWSQAEADVQRLGLLRMAAQVGILPAGPADGDPRRHLPLFEDAADVLSDRHGLWFPAVDVGASVARGTRLGRLEDAFGDTVQEILAPVAGVLTFGL